MKIYVFLTLLALLAAMGGCAGRHQDGATEVRFAGDARVYGVYFSNRHFTGRN